MKKKGKRNLTKSAKGMQGLMVVNLLKPKRKKLIQNMQTYRANQDESIKSQERVLNSKCMQNYIAKHC